MAEVKPTKVVIGPARFSYLHVLEAVAIGDSTEKKYSVALLIPKSDKVSLAKIEAAVKAAIEIGKTKWGDKVPPPSKLKLPLRDGDEEKGDDPVYKGMHFLNANCSNRPQVVDKNKNEILDKEEIYSGMWGLASVTFYPFDTNGNKGIACGLNNLMKTKDGEKLSSQSTAEEDFADIDADELDTDIDADEPGFLD